MLLALKIGGAVACEIKTDSVLFRPKKRQRVDLDTVSFKDLNTLFTKAYPLSRPLAQMAAQTSDDKPFRQAPAIARDLMRTEQKTQPCRAWDLALQQRVYEDLDPAEGERRALEGQSLLVTGIAGTGKTT